jgi:hypothetical protein
MTTTFNLPDMVWSCLSTDGDLEAVFADVSPETRAQVRQISLDLWMRFNDKKLHLQDTHNRLSAAAADRAEFEQLAWSHPDREVLLAMGLGADIDAAVWKRVKP